MVSKRAYRHGWVQKRTELGREIREKEIDSRLKDRETVKAAVSYILADIAGSLKDGRLGLNLQDGEGFLNPIYKKTWDEALKEHFKDTIMGKMDEPPEDDPAELGTTQDILNDIRNRIGK